jgi:hypothetical protein
MLIRRTKHMADDNVTIERAARHLIDSFGTGAAKVADQRARHAGETQDAGIYGQTWTAIAAKVREIEDRAARSRVILR